MRLIPVALALFYKFQSPVLEVWTQKREDDGPFHGLMEFPGGGIEPGEEPLAAAVREVDEEVGIKINPEDGVFMGIYSNEYPGKTILLYVYLFPNQASLSGKGEWLRIEQPELSAKYQGIIPGPNHRIIDELFQSLYSNGP